jgi:hypothetical protein
MDEGGMISPAMADSYSSSSRAESWASERPVWERREAPLARAFLEVVEGVSMEERT